MTIMTYVFAEKCGLAHLIDKRFQGLAVGVGSSKIIGRIHAAPLKVGWQGFFLQVMMGAGVVIREGVVMGAGVVMRAGVVCKGDRHGLAVGVGSSKIIGASMRHPGRQVGVSWQGERRL